MASPGSRPQRLGEILVGGGLITPHQLDCALEAQIIFGGRLGTNLVDLECLSVDQVGHFLGVQHGVPVASSAELESATDEVVGLLPRHVCTRYRVFPLSTAPRALHLAMMDPGDLSAIDELTFLSGMRIAPHVVPELRLMQVLEKRLGVLRERRFLRVAGEPEPPPGPDRRPRSISALFPSVAAVVAPPAADTNPELAYLDDVMGELRAPSTAAAADDFELDILVEEPEEESTAVQLPNGLTLPTAAAVSARLLEAGDRNEVFRLLLEPFADGAAQAVVLLVRGEMAVGQLATGTGHAEEEVRRLVLPLTIPSLLQKAFSRRSVVHGTTRDDPLQQLIARHLRWDDPEEACVAAVSLGERVVNLLCVQSTRGSRFEDSFVAGLGRLSEAVAASYVRLIRRRRAGSEPPPRSPEAGPPPPALRDRRLFLTGHVGRGRSTTVWRAIDTSLPQVVAVKVLDPGALDPRQLQQLIRSVEVLRELDHPCIGKVLEAGATVDGRPYLVAEWLSGEDLRARRARGTCSAAAAATILAQVAGALAVAQARGVVHGDLRPSNIHFPTPAELALKVVDFGVTVAGAQADEYAPPERGAGQPLGPPADVYGLAALARELVSSRSPTLERVIAAGLAAAPEDRPPVQELARALVAALRARGTC